MTEFTRRIYEVVKQIPKGCVASYGQVAQLAGNPRGARGVGFALHRNPEPGVIPCHRVVFQDGSTCTGYAFGGPEVQRRLLEEEGVTFLPDGRIAWPPAAGCDGIKFVPFRAFAKKQRPRKLRVCAFRGFFLLSFIPGKLFCKLPGQLLRFFRRMPLRFKPHKKEAPLQSVKSYFLSRLPLMP